jgi:hypothetical protein
MLSVSVYPPLSTSESSTRSPMTCFINRSHQSVCMCIPLQFPANRQVKYVTAVKNTLATIEELLRESFSMRSVSFQRKIRSSQDFFSFSIYLLNARVKSDCCFWISRKPDYTSVCVIIATFPSGTTPPARHYSGNCLSNLLIILFGRARTTSILHCDNAVSNYMAVFYSVRSCLNSAK